eukprot:212170_1
MILRPYYIASVTYILGRFGLESVFILRVYKTFKNNIFQISKTVLILLFVWMIIVSILWVCIFLADLLNIENNTHYNLVYISVTISDALLIVSLLYLFIKRLQRVVIREAIEQRSNYSNSSSKSSKVTMSASNSVITPPNHTTLPSVSTTMDPKIDHAMYNITTQNKFQQILMYFCCCMMNDKDIKSIKSDLKSQNS